MIKRFYEHSFELDLIVPGGWGIDFGCGADFLISKTMSELGLNVISVDPNPSITEVPNIKNMQYERVALVTDPNIKSLDFNIYNDNDAATLLTPIKDVSFVKKKETISVNAMTIDQIMKKYNINQFEILKLDIEGAEYDFLMTIDFPIAKQISVEFHDFRSLNPEYPNNEIYYNKLFNKLLKYYKIAKHKIEQHPGLPGPQGYNYWDSLFVLK